jgi:TolB-like protein/DNA-binding winged helix-turn-helix (wHTH) protein
MTELADRPGESVAIDLAREADFAIGALLVRPSACEVGTTSDSRRIEPRVMQVLIALARADGAVVSRDELVRTCWGGLIVGDDAINRVIGRIRRLGEADPAPFAIETIPKIGYRLTRAGAAAPGATPAKAADRRGLIRRWALAAVGLVAAAAGVVAGLVVWKGGSPPAPTPAVVAVLPFDNLSGDPSLQYLSDGVSAEIQSTLARYQDGMRVTGLATSFRFRGAGKDPANVRRSTGATHLIDGSVRREGDQVRVVAQVIDARDGAVLWTQTYDRPLEHVLDIETLVARRTAAVLHVAAPDIASSRDPIPAEALEAYLRALQLFDTEDLAISTKNAEAVAALETTTRLAPQFAWGWARLSEAYHLQGRRQNEAEQAQTEARARAAAEQAVKLDPGLAYAYVMLGRTEPEWNWPARWLRLKQALARGRNDVFVLLYWNDLSVRSGLIAQSNRIYHEFIQLDPLSDVVRDREWQALAEAGDFAGAEAALRRIVAQDPAAVRTWIALVEAAADAHNGPAARRAMQEVDANWAQIRARLPQSDQQVEVLREGWRKDAAMADQKQSASELSAEALRRFDLLQAGQGQGCAGETLQAVAGLKRLDLAWAIAEELYLRKGYVGRTDRCSHALYRARQAATWPLFKPETSQMRRDPRIWRIFAAVGLSRHWLDTGEWPDFCAEPGLPYKCRDMARASLAPR